MLLNNGFETKLQALAERAPHAVLFEGVRGKAASQEAEMYVKLLQATHGGTVRQLEKTADKTVISIEQMQSLYRATRAKKAAGEHDIWLIAAANTMSEPAQNAFLKLLEEPPSATHFVLGTPQLSTILPTVRSRTHIVRAAPFNSEMARQWLNQNNIPNAEQPQLLFLARGSVSELQKLVADKDYRSSRLTIARQAKQFISEPTYQKIVVAAQVAANREQSEALLACALDMLVATLATQPTHSKQLQTLSATYERVLANGNTRLQLLRAALQL